MLTQIGRRGITRVFCEGGGALAASLLDADLVDELVVFTAGLAIGAEGLLMAHQQQPEQQPPEQQQQQPPPLPEEEEQQTQ